MEKMKEDRQELLEIYKLHAELADRVSQRREGANRLYVSLLTSFFILVAAVVRFGSGQIPVPEWLILFVSGVLGIALSVSWYITLKSHRQLNSGKFKALHELEEKLAYPFFKREWDFLKEGKDRRIYWELTLVERYLPCIFGLVSFGFIVASICS